MGDHEGQTGMLGLRLRLLQCAFPLGFAEGGMHHEQLAREDALQQLDQHRLRVLAAAVVGDEQGSGTD